jgi:hypothetical protein
MNNNIGDSNLTFAVKSTTRPSVTLTTQELSQYNKKRVIYTGYKTDPLDVVFYDSADQAAQSLWAAYSQYYFGDFAQSYTAFGDDIETASSNWIANLGSAGFGYTAANGGQTGFGTQFLIKYIEILQFNGGTYDTYTCINPKITVFKPDDLDYSASDVSTIAMTFAYEAVIYSPGSGGLSSANIEEFQEGEPFFGNPLEIPALNAEIPTEFYVPNAVSNDSITSSILGALFGGVTTSLTSAPNYNYYNSTTGGGLGIFGNFVFGAANSAAVAATSSMLAAQSVNNPALTAALGLSYTSNPALNPSNAYGVQAGISSALYDGVAGISTSATENSTTSSILAAGLLTDALVGNSNGGAKTVAGLALSAAALGAINSQRSGTSQFGYNPQIDVYGNNYGYQGPSGYVAPSAPSPYAPAQAFGAYTTPATTGYNTVYNVNVPTPTPSYNTNYGPANTGTVDESNLIAVNGSPLANFFNSAPPGSSYTDPVTGITYNN